MQNANQHQIPAAVLPVKRFAGFAILLSLTITLLSACGGGADSQSKPSNNNDEEVPVYAGSYQSDDTRAFKQEVWEKLSPASVCGRCHRSDADPANRQKPYFVDWQDVNVAYDAVVSGNLANLANPAQSVLVSRVANGHQCWLGSNSECAAAMTSYIQAWANGSQRGETNVQVQIKPLDPSQIQAPGQSLFFPVTAPASYYTDDVNDSIHTLVTTYCSGCHVNKPGGRFPYFAEADVETSYQAIKTVIDLNEPSSSRVYTRLVDRHNCWDDCTANSNEMLLAIQNLAGSLSLSSFDPDDAVSKALTMVKGFVASSGNRYEANQIALYEFKSGSINPDSRTIEDTSGVEPAMNLTIYGNGHRWLSNWGLEFTGSRAQAEVSTSRKLYNLIRLTGEYSIEAWVIPGNITQENASIISYSGSSSDRNFVLGQTMYNYDFYQRSSSLGTDGEPKLMTNDDDQDLQATLQHVVITYDRNAGRRIYVNGEFTDDDDTVNAGDLLNWHPSYVLAFGNEPSNNRPWTGIIRMVAIHDRALNPDQIRQNYAAEVGQKYLVPFSVSHLLNDGVPNSYVVFEVNEFDEFSYLFRNPRFINVDPNTPGYMPNDVTLKGLRIGMNGQDVKVGQAYNNVSIDNLADGYSPETGVLLSEIDTVIQIQNGKDTDEFFLTFEQLGDHTYNFVETNQTVIPPLPAENPGTKLSDVGLRTFDEINAAMAQMTGISDWQNVTGITGINDIYTTYRRQFPATENIETFASSHQMAISQLAMSYCNELVRRDSTAASDDLTRYFSGFVYTANSAADIPLAFEGAAKYDLIIKPLLKNMLNAKDVASDNATENLQTQPNVVTIAPDKTGVKEELVMLINGNGLPVGDAYRRLGLVADTTCPLVNGTPSCTQRVKQIVTGTCAAVLGSAVMLIQ